MILLEGKMSNFAKGISLQILVLILFTFSAFADSNSRIQQEPNQIADDRLTAEFQGIAGPFLSSLTLDEPQIGDTIVVALNYRDQQHNAGFNRMIAFDSDEENPIIHTVWTNHETTGTVRLINFVKVKFDDSNVPYVSASPRDVGVATGGYSTIELQEIAGVVPERPILNWHESMGGATSAYYHMALAAEASFFENMFATIYECPFEIAVELNWPQFAIASYNDVIYAHVVGDGYADPNDEEVYYSRHIYDGTLETWTPIIDGPENNALVFNKSQTLTTNVCTSDDGAKVAIVTTFSRWMNRGNLPSDWDGYAIAQSDNDVVYWESTDGGENWDFDTFTNVTNFVTGDEQYLPGDTTAANQDSLRAYAEVDGVYDSEGTLHLTFNLAGFDYFRGSTYQTASLYYWNSAEQKTIRIADGDFWNWANMPDWEKTICHGNLSIDPDTGYLWVMWNQYGEPDEFTDNGDGTYTCWDASDDGVHNGDIYVSCSPDGGYHWAKGVNITNTKPDGIDGDLVAGDCRSERDPSMAYNIEGDYLHFFYTMDFDAGVSGITGSGGDGEITENEMVYHRVLKSDLYTMFDEDATWVTNYPIHYEGETHASYWEDPDGWDWDTVGFNFSSTSNVSGNTLSPEEFKLSQNYPNPFNPSTKISFDLKKAGVVELAIFDVLGREVAQLVNRNMSAGSHEVSFVADGIPSGVYFYKLTSGDATQIRKMVLMK